MIKGNQSGEAAPASRPSRSWIPPVLEKLPRLTSLTLQSFAAIPGTGSVGEGGGSTVF